MYQLEKEEREKLSQIKDKVNQFDFRTVSKDEIKKSLLEIKKILSTIYFYKDK